MQIFCTAAAGLQEMNPIPAEYRDHIGKYIPLMRSFNEGESADYLQLWLDDAFEKAPLLDVLACLGITFSVGKLSRNSGRLSHVL